ncbi:MAG: PrsW family intramembrane metalloprotease [Bacteroidales bacterium]|nr:PrsW family intramembrane metalloprotease [Bacteroidales bacterium]
MNYNSIIALLIAPVFALFMFLYFKSRIEKKSYNLLFKSFLFGFISIILAVIVQIITSQLGYDDLRNLKRITFYSFIVIGGGAELSKFIVLRYFILTKNQSKNPFAGITYSVMTALGFATAGLILFILNIIDTSYLYPINFYSFTFAITHIIFAVLMGFFVSISMVRKPNFIYALSGLFTAFFFHGFFVFCILTRDYKLLSVFSFGALLIVFILLYKAIMSAEERTEE